MIMITCTTESKIVASRRAPKAIKKPRLNPLSRPKNGKYNKKIFGGMPGVLK